jgi:two-component system LytT family response regulator
MTCIVVDDEPLAREAIVTLISQMPELELLKEFSSADSASRYLDSQPVDIIFLDIQILSPRIFRKIRW